MIHGGSRRNLLLLALAADLVILGLALATGAAHHLFVTIGLGAAALGVLVEWFHVFRKKDARERGPVE